MTLEELSKLSHDELYNLAQKNDTDAQAELGVRYSTGTSVDEDAKKGYFWLKSAAERGNPRGMAQVGVNYLTGQGVVKNPSEAIRWFELAAENNNRLGMFKLGQIYLKGIHHSKDIFKAIHYFNSAAELGHVEAKQELDRLKDNLKNGSVSDRHFEKFSSLTGLSEVDLACLLGATGWIVDDAIKNIDLCVTGAAGAAYSQEAILEGIINSGIYDKLANNLSELNTMRGGVKGGKGFVFEHLHAADASINGQVIKVINDNGIADFMTIGPKGEIGYAQAKVGCNTCNVDFSKFKDQTIIIDKGNTQLINRAKAAGAKVVESNVPAEEAHRLSKLMQLESKITGNTNSVIVPKINSAINVAKEAHNVGLNTAKSGAQFGGGFSLGSNIVEVISGDKEFGAAATDIVKDTAISAGVGYATGTVATIVGNTAAGAAITSVAGTATAAVTSTAVGGAVVTAGTAAAGAIGGLGTAAVTSTLAAGTAVGSTVAAAGATIGTAIAGTSVGGAAIAAGTAAGTALAGTAVGGAAIAAGTAATGAAIAAGTAVAAAAVAAAPVVAVGAAIGGIFCLGKKLFGK
jgi:hypothetical protein